MSYYVSDRYLAKCILILAIVLTIHAVLPRDSAAAAERPRVQAQAEVTNPTHSPHVQQSDLGAAITKRRLGPWLEGPYTPKTDWMAQLADELLISELTVPGTHETLSDHGICSVCNTLPLIDQLNAGIRAFDFRLRHKDDRLEVWHGLYYLNTYFDDVLLTCRDFLQDHPNETIFMRIKQTCTCTAIGCPQCTGNTRSFAETLAWYAEVFDPSGTFIFSSDLIPSSCSDMLTLGEIRGRILYLQNFQSDYGVGTGEAGQVEPWRDRASCVGHFDEDDYPDLAVINPASSEVCVFRSVRGGVFGHYDEVLTVSGGTNPSSVCSGDFDANGYDDLAVTYMGTDNVGIFLRDENGFRSGALYPVLNIPWSICVANFDGQPGLDFVVTNWGDGGERASLLRNNGDGTFGVTHFWVGNHPLSVTAADLNDDDYPDLATTHWTNIVTDNDYFKSWVNDGAGGFSNYDYRGLGRSMNPSQVLAADFDGDGRDELLFGTTASGIKAFWNNGTGLTEIATLPEGGYGKALAAADVDGDLNKDLIVVNLNSRSVSVFLSEGGFAFSEPYAIEWGMHPSAVSEADFDGDGDMDLAVTGYGPINDVSGGHSIWGIPRMSVLLNHGNNAWCPAEPLGLYWPSFDIQDAYQVGPKCGMTYTQKWNYIRSHLDKARFGDPGVLFINHLSGVCISGTIPQCHDSPKDIAAAMNAETGRYLFSALNSGQRWRCGIIMADLPGDGLIDVVLAHNEFLFRAEQPDLMGVAKSSAGWGDFDNDGDLDLLLSGDTGTEYVSMVYRNDDGTLTDVGVNLPGLTYSSTAWGDYDNDGDLDILITGQTQAVEQVSRVYRNDSGEFTDVGAGLIDVDTGSVAWGDYDNDGDLDILLTGWTGSDAVSRVYRNNAGSFTEEEIGLPDLFYSAVAWGDYDNDGDLDILLTGQTAGDWQQVSRVYRNDSDTGSFDDISADLIDVDTGSVAWGDYDDDGDLDILLTGWTGSESVSRVYRNDAGIFTDAEAGLPGMLFSAGAWGDYDNDGTLDVALTGEAGEGNLTRVYRGDGQGGFVRDYSWLAPLFTGSIAPGDYDGDGDLDLALTGYNAELAPDHRAYVYENTSTVENTPPSSPTNLRADTSGDGVVTFRWDAATDAETPVEGLTYNLRVGTTPGGDEILSAMADASTGRRLIPAMGNVGHTLSWSLARPPLDQKYHWSVQAIDGALEGSEFASEKVLGVLAIQLESRATPAGIELIWGMRVTSEIQALVIRRGERAGVLAPRWEFAGAEAASDGRWVDTEVRWGSTYRYCVSVQTEGVWVDSAEIEVTAGGSEVPERTRLVAAVPNPFNPKTTLRFALAEAGDVSIRIFDVAGRQVHELQLPGLGAGWHEAEWNGEDDSGRRVASGSYMVRLEAAHRYDQMRVLLLK